MSNNTDPNNPAIRPGDAMGDHKVLRVAPLTHVNAFFYELEHGPTGARHAHISRADRENTFAVAFKTVPRDSTGVAHILEHTALCGSEKYPLRDPFFSMIKRSLNTFMNAFTAADWTMYPFSTQNEKDYYNLMDVYLDAAFYPRLDRLSFKQEGHRLEIEGDGGNGNGGDFKLAYKGVVYNEMKGAMSSPDQVMGRAMMRALFPDTTYGHNSGGDPERIPALTHQGLVEFHRYHYHPSNAFFYTYGDLPLARHLEFITEKALSRFDRIQPGTDVPAQPRWAAPREATCPYPFDPDEDPAKKHQACLAWLTADVKDAFEVLSLALLEDILLGNAASPLRKALLESGLGSAPSDGAGYVSDYRDTVFAAGLKETAEADAPKIADLILDTLTGLRNGGIDRRLIESALHQVEFHRREVTNSPYPYGLKLFLFFSGAWFHGADPARTLMFDEDIETIRRAVDAGGFFEERIGRYLLDNPHRVLFRLAPDQQLERERNRCVAEELDRVKSGLGPADIAAIRADMKALAERQDAPEDPSALPTLELSDISPDVPRMAPAEGGPDAPVTLYRQPTSGIFYFTGAFGASAIRDRLSPLLPFFCYAVSRMGTRRRDYAEMARELATHTGGLGLGANARTRFDEGGTCLSFITFSGKSLSRNVEKMFDLMAELILEHDFNDLARLRHLLMEYRSGLESMVVHNGHRLAMSLASRNYSRSHALGEVWGGVHQFRAIKDLVRNIDNRGLENLAGDLFAIGRQLFAAGNLKMALIGEQEDLDRAERKAADLTCAMPTGGLSGFDPPAIDLGPSPLREGWRTTTAVSFVAQVFETARMSHPDAPALGVIAKLLRSLYLHREIREKGGAYGGFSIFNPEDGLFAMASYRDPHIANTLSVFRGAADFIRSGGYSDADIKEAILQICSDMDRPDPPGPAARKAYYRMLLSLSDADRKGYKARLLEMDRKRVAEAAERYFSALSDASVAVISGGEQLTAANGGDLPGGPLSLYAI